MLLRWVSGNINYINILRDKGVIFRNIIFIIIRFYFLVFITISGLGIY